MLLLSSVAAARAPLSFSPYFVMIIVIIVIILSVCPAPSPRRSFLQAVLFPGWGSAQSFYRVGCTDWDIRHPLHTPISYLPCSPSSVSSLAWNFFSFYPCVDTVSLLRHQVKWYIIGIFPDVAISLLLDRTVFRASQWHGAQRRIISHYTCPEAVRNFTFISRRLVDCFLVHLCFNDRYNNSSANDEQWKREDDISAPIPHLLHVFFVFLIILLHMFC
jgi:hypothetical protein